MANQISAEAGALAKGQQAVQDAQDGIKSEISRVRGELENLGQYWSGDAATAYRNLVEQWDQKTTSINEQLTQLKDSLKSTEQEQERNEEANKASVSKIAGMLS